MAFRTVHGEGKPRELSDGNHMTEYSYINMVLRTVHGEGRPRELSDGYHMTEDSCNGIGRGGGIYPDGSETTPGVRPYPLTDDAFGHGLGSGFGLFDKPGIPTNVDTTYNDLNIRG